MSSGTDETASTETYELTCTDCAFETTVRGSAYEALDVAKEHRDEYRDPSKEHFVNFTRNGPAGNPR